MLSGLKFIPRDQIDKSKDSTSDDSTRDRRKTGRRKEKNRKETSRYSSSDDEGLERIRSRSRKKKKWYASDEEFSSCSDRNGSDNDSKIEQKQKSVEAGTKTYDGSSQDKHRSRSKKKRKSRRNESEEGSSCDSESENPSKERTRHKGGKRSRKKDEKGKKNNEGDEIVYSDMDDDNEGSQNYNNIVRREMGLDWMLRPKDNTENTSKEASDMPSEEAAKEEDKKVNPRELNPYLKDNGSGYPEESDGMKSRGNQLLSSAVVGDGGASWRLKALKRAQEQATREGRKLQAVVEERWGSMGQFAASVASYAAAPAHAHLQAIRSRQRGLMEEEQIIDDEKDMSALKNSNQRSTMDVASQRHTKMRVPKFQDSLSWRKRGSQNKSSDDSALVSAAMSSLNRFSNDGSFMEEFLDQKNGKSVDPSNSSHNKFEKRAEPKSVESDETKEDARTANPPLSANQLVAKAMQLRMKGKHEEAEKLLREAENIRATRLVGNESSRPQIDGTTSRYIVHDVSTRQKTKGEDADLHLAQAIMHNHQYSSARQADDEYDYDDGPRRKARKKGGGGNQKSTEISNSVKRFFTQQERCQFCFENPTRPKHLVVAIANFTYLSLPQWQPVVPGHCCILTLQHEASTRTVDDNVWDEIRNFKKCLIMMFAKQERDVLFLETVMGLAQQRRHCMVECIPLPQDLAKQAPVYFKKAIDEAEEEWSQHNAKKLIDTSEKGLRASIPKNFPYFHVEFGLNKGFVHVIDNEKEFKSSFGLNVVRGMLRLPAEDMHRRRKHESMETQRQAVANFAQDWEAFDWTKQLN